MLNYKGLRKQQSFDGLIDYLEHHQEKIKYPNRIATEMMKENFFNSELEELKNMRGMMMFNLFKTDRATQTDFYRTKGVNVNLDKFREQYEARLATGRCHLEGGSVKQIKNWKNKEVMKQQIQPMVLEINKIYYGRKKLMNWLNAETVVQPEMDPSASDAMLHSIQVQVDAAAAIGISMPFNFLVPSATAIADPVAPATTWWWNQTTAVSPTPTPVPSPVRTPVATPVRTPVRTPVSTPAPSRAPSPIRSPSPIHLPSPIRSPTPSPVSFASHLPVHHLFQLVCIRLSDRA